jgi:hypothetical protein
MVAGFADDLAVPGGRRAEHDLRFAWRAAAEFEHHARAQIQAGAHEFRVDAAFEPVAGIGDDAEFAAGARRCHRIPERGLDQHVGGAVLAARKLAAHDAGDRFHAVVVGDHAHVGRQRILRAVQRQHLFAGARAPHHQVALHPGRVEHVQRPAAVEGDVIGDVDQRVDRPEPDGDQALLQPFRRRSVLDPPHQPEREAGAQIGRLERDGNRAFALAFDRFDRAGLQRAEPGGGEVAGDAVNAGGVGAVRRQADLDHRIVELGPFGEGRAHRRVLGQVDNAGVLVGKLQFALRTHHAVALHAADLADRQRDVDARHIGARRGEGADQAGARVGRAAHHLHRRAAARVDRQHLELVGVGVFFRRQHPGDHKRLQRRLVVDGFDLEPDHGQPFDDLVERGVGVEMVLEPGKGEFHCVSSVGLGTLDLTCRGSESGMCTKGSCSRTWA